MTVQDGIDGWWDVPPLPAWKCPECKRVSPVAEWNEQDVYCEDCGDHEGRRCPNCETVFDHVWGDREIATEQEPTR